MTSDIWSQCPPVGNVFQLVCDVYLTTFSLFRRLALYVYEYLLHIGAQKAAQTFLTEVSESNFLSAKKIAIISIQLFVLEVNEL